MRARLFKLNPPVVSVLLALAVAGLLAALGCGGGDAAQVASTPTSSAPTSSEPSPATTFEGVGYSFTYPGAWAKRADGKYDVRVVPPDLGGDVSLIVHRDALTTPVTSANIDQVVQADRPAVDAYVQSSVGVLESGPTALTYAGLPGLDFEASVTIAGQPAHERVTWLYDRLTLYVFRCLFVPARAEEVEQACDQVLNSFKVE